MVVINIFGSPCSGKSTTAAGVFYLLKQMGKNVEMSLEYVKDCVYDGNKYPFTDQIFVFANMLKRLRQYDGKVDFVVTDAPLLMNHIYGTNESCEFHRLVDVEFNKYKNINFVVRRGDAPYTNDGRIHSVKEANDLQDSIESMLEERGIDAPIYCIDEDTADNIVKDTFSFLKGLYK